MYLLFKYCYVVYTSYVTKNLMNSYRVKIKIWDLRFEIVALGLAHCSQESRPQPLVKPKWNLNLYNPVWTDASFFGIVMYTEQVCKQ